MHWIANPSSRLTCAQFDVLSTLELITIYKFVLHLIKSPPSSMYEIIIL